MSESELSIANNSGSSIHCYVCNNRAGVSIRNAVQIFGDQFKLPSTKRPLHEAIEELTEKPLNKDKNTSSIICKKCYKLFEEYEELKERMNNIKAEIKEQFDKIVNNRDDSIASKPPNVITIVQKSLKATTAESPIKNSESIIIKKDLTPPSKQKKIPVISMKNVTKLPSNFVVVNQQGKIAIQNTNSTSPVKNQIQPTLEIIQDAEKKDSPKKILTLVGKSAPIKSILNTDKTAFKRDITPLVDDDEEDDADDIADDDMEIEEVEHNAEECTQRDMKPENGELQDGEYEGIETLDEMEEEGGSFVISHMEILNDDNSMELEEGTILVEQEADGTIRLLSHSGDLYDGEFVNDDTEISDEDLENSEPQENKSGESVRKPRIMRLKSKQSTLMRKGTATSIEDLPSYNEMVKQVSDGLFQCLLCPSDSSEKSANEEEKKSSHVKSIKTEITEDIDMDLKGEDDKPIADDDNKDGEKAKDEGDTQSFFGSSKVMTQHLRVIHKVAIHLCPICGKVFSKRSDYNHHLQYTHSSDESALDYKCAICSEAFGSLKMLRLHKFQHKDMKQHVCQVCNRKFGSKKLLEEHNNMHIGVKPYNCVLCDKSFASKYTYQSHCKTHTDRPRPYSCSQCGKSFFTLQNKTQHEKTHLGIKDFVCNVCGKAFGTQHNLDVHGVVHTGYKPYQCWICKKAFARRAEIRDHERIHTGERPYACDICGSTFSQRSNLQSHKRATHFDDKRYKCKSCDKSFKRRRLLEYHIKSSHTGERPFKCDICEATFVYPEHFKKHTRIHSGEKPYTCEVCGKAFNSRDNRNAHRFIHSDKKPYECLDCGAGFMRKPLLYVHMQQQGHLNDTIIVNQPRISNDLDNKMDQIEGTIILENGQEVIINNIKDEALVENRLGGKYTLTSASDDVFETEFTGECSQLIVRTGSGIKNEPIIVQTQGGDEDLDKDGTEVETGEMVGVDGETIISSDMIDTQRIYTIDSNDQQQIQSLEIEDGSVRFFQIHLPNGENGWVALNNTQEDA